MELCDLCRLCAVFFVLVVRVSAQDGIEAEEAGVNYSAAVGWESRYISEGRNNLDDGGIATIEAGVGFEGFDAGFWYALADTVSYDELNLFCQYGVEVNSVELYAGYTRLEFLKDDDYDNEFYAGVALNHFDRLVPALEYVHSTEAQNGDGGGFAEASLTAPVELLDGRLILAPYLLQGFDFGYASDHYDGFNNFQFGLGAHYELTEIFHLRSSLNHSIANHDVRCEGGGDETWFTIGICAAL